MHGMAMARFGAAGGGMGWGHATSVVGGEGLTGKMRGLTASGLCGRGKLNS